MVGYRSLPEQRGKVTFIDDDAKNEDKGVIAEDYLSGKSGEVSDCITASKIEELKALGYEVVSDDFPKDGMHDDANQNFAVYLKHKHSDMKPKEPGKSGEPLDPKFYPDEVK